jgi:ergothioneine biosynthesis protein EgtB
MALTESLPITSRSTTSDDDRRSLLDRYREVRDWTSKIIEPLQIEDMVVQTATECSPTKWQLGHTTWFFETFVLGSRKEYRPFHESYGFLFNSYYNSVGDRVARPIRGLMSRPTVAEVLEYREHVDDALALAIESADQDWWNRFRDVIELGLHHEQQQQELMITDVKTVLALNPLRPIYREREIASHEPGDLQWIEFDGGLVEIGHDGNGFAFDNEYGRHKVYLEPFALADRLITNAEYLDFVRAGGYNDPRYWLSDGWAKVESEGWRSPRYWEQLDDDCWMMSLQGFRPVELTEPVTHISYYEADAFATWAGAQLPTEWEWEHAAAGHSGSIANGNFLESTNFHPVALQAERRRDIHQLFGDVWEWTRSAYLPYPRFKVADGALGEYNGKFMSNQMVLRGGSCATAQTHIRASYRNFFPPESRWQFSGIRLARGVR